MIIGLGCLLLVLTTVVHTTAMVVGIRGLRVARADRWAAKGFLRREMVVAILVVIMFAAGLWASTYLVVGAISGLEEAAYFSMVTYTTLGYGDLTLEPPWRLLASFQAANGTIMFGWTTAVIVAAVQRMYVSRTDSDGPMRP
jgi:hypothetical protein